VISKIKIFIALSFLGFLGLCLQVTHELQQGVDAFYKLRLALAQDRSQALYLHCHKGHHAIRLRWRKMGEWVSVCDRQRTEETRRYFRCDIMLFGQVFFSEDQLI
jgi:hypothetical protein